MKTVRVILSLPFVIKAMRKAVFHFKNEVLRALDDKIICSFHVCLESSRIIRVNEPDGETKSNGKLTEAYLEALATLVFTVIQ